MYVVVGACGRMRVSERVDWRIEAGLGVGRVDRRV